MATKKNNKKESEVSKAVGLNVSSANFIKIRDVLGKFLVFNKISSVLSIIFYIVWIPIGLFFVWFIIANFRLGAFDQLMGPPPAQTAQEMPTDTQAPTETSVPGVGTVNVDCVQNNLSEESIIKMVQDKGTQNLTDEEKTKLEPCIVAAETASPEASPQE